MEEMAFNYERLILDKIPSEIFHVLYITFFKYFKYYLLYYVGLFALFASKLRYVIHSEIIVLLTQAILAQLYFLFLPFPLPL